MFVLEGHDENLYGVLKSGIMLEKSVFVVVGRTHEDRHLDSGLARSLEEKCVKKSVNSKNLDFSIFLSEVFLPFLLQEQ